MSSGELRSRALGYALLWALGGSGVHSARAEPAPAAVDPLEEARSWYRDGLSLEAAGDWAQALGRFERVAEVRLTPQVRFHVARCKEHLGRFTEALGDYRISEYEAERDHVRELGEITLARQSLEARVPKLEIVRGQGAERATVRLDGVELGQRSFGAELGVDPGTHQIQATSVGAKDFEHTFVAEEGARTRVEVRLDALPTAVPSGEPKDPGALPAPERSGPGSLASAEAVSPWPLVLAGTGLVAAGAGVFFLVDRSRASDAQARHCVGSVCNQDFEREVDAATTREARDGTLAWVAFSLAGASLAGATWLWLDGAAADAHASDRARLHLGAALGETEWSLAVGACF